MLMEWVGESMGDWDSTDAKAGELRGDSGRDWRSNPGELVEVAGM
jgi:hypothetical protein